MAQRVRAGALSAGEAADHAGWGGGTVRSHGGSGPVGVQPVPLGKVRETLETKSQALLPSEIPRPTLVLAKYLDHRLLGRWVHLGSTRQPEALGQYPFTLVTGFAGAGRSQQALLNPNGQHPILAVCTEQEHCQLPISSAATTVSYRP